MEQDDREILFVGTAEAEHVEMYLKAIWHLNERGEDVKISSIAKMLHVRQPSVVQMLKKLDSQKLVSYNKSGVSLTGEGGKVGSTMMRNSRLLEVLMDSALKIEIDEEMVCGIEHHMSQQFTDALCTMLGHPRACPHGLAIPAGECCKSPAAGGAEGEEGEAAGAVGAEGGRRAPAGTGPSAPGGAGAAAVCGPRAGRGPNVERAGAAGGAGRE